MIYDNVILIDDDHIIRYGFKSLMNNFFSTQELLMFENGEDGLEHLDNLDIEHFNKKTILFLDLNMPLVDGWCFLEKFKEKFPSLKEHISIYILSSSINKENIIKLKENKLVSGFIHKPITLDELRALIT